MPFILLCKQELLKDLERLRDEHLLEWSGEPQPVDERVTWIELNHCMVISQAWDGVFINNQALKDALEPTVKLSISLSSGLRVPKQRGWLEGYPPQITIFGFFPKAQLQVIDLLDEKVILERSQKTNQPMPLDVPRQGTYLIKATHAKESVERLVSILDWRHLEIALPDRQQRSSIREEYFMQGSIIGVVQ
ncbi:MAG: hypothetical protein HC820_07480 [Hydrococcus sp. RM1_1_31]|nr:hypothetical protein [Hydrococcus sp. RM1_1_31]